MLTRYFGIWISIFFSSILAFGNCAEVLLNSQSPVSIQVSIMDREKAEERFGDNLESSAKSFLLVEISKRESSSVEFIELVLRMKTEEVVRQSFSLGEGPLKQLFGLSISQEAIMALTASRQIIPKDEILEVTIDLNEVQSAPNPGPKSNEVPSVPEPQHPSSAISSEYSHGVRTQMAQPGAESYAAGQRQTHLERSNQIYQNRTGLSVDPRYR
jgi:hypothetical protein